MKKLEQFVAVPNKRAQLTGKELEDLVREAEGHPDIQDVTQRRSSVTLRATSDAVEDLKRKMQDRVIIEPDKPLSLLGR